MAIDFRASQLQTNKIISSGSTGTGAKLLIYDVTASTSSFPNSGIIDTLIFDTGSIGTDVFLFVSGGVETGSYGMSVFGGTILSSGSLSVALPEPTVLDRTQLYFSAAPDTRGAFVKVLDLDDGTDYIVYDQQSTFQDITLKAGSVVVSGSGGWTKMMSGNGGLSSVEFEGHAGGKIILDAGDGGDGEMAGNGGTGGVIQITAGRGGAVSDVGMSGQGGYINITAGDAGTVLGEIGISNQGGGITLTAGSPSGPGFVAGAMTFVGGMNPSLDEQYNSGTLVEWGNSSIQRMRKFLINGTADLQDPLAIPQDVFFYASGTITSSNYPDGHAAVSMFGGDLVASGNLMSTKTKTFSPVAGYLSTTATSSNPEVAGQAMLSMHEVPNRNVFLRVVLSTTDDQEVATAMLYNVTSGVYVDMESDNIQTLTTYNTTPTVLESWNLVTPGFAGGFNVTGSSVYELRVFTTTGSVNTILGSAMFVCSA